MKKLFKTEKRRDQAIVLFLAILLAGILGDSRAFQYDSLR